MSDIDRIRREVSLPDIVRTMGGVELFPSGHEFEGCCPFHAEKTPSFTLFPGKDGVWRFHCFGCGVGGDVIDFVSKLQGVDTAEAIKILNGDRAAGRNIAPVQIPARDPYAGIIRLDPPKELAPGKKIILYNPKREQNGNINPSATYPYMRQDSSIYGYVIRHDLPDGGKETPQVCWVRLPDGRECWCRLPFEKPRLLYGLPRLSAEGQVFIVEGEKCADAMFETTGRVVLSWPGGTNGVGHCDWSPLAGRDVIIIPDHDAPGWEARRSVEKVLNGVAKRVRWVDIQKGLRRARDDF